MHDAINVANPKTVFGLIAAGLARRHAERMPPFTVMSCDNIPHNGRVTADAVIGLTRVSSSAFADWIADNVAFPNGMVDRITPATTDRERKLLADEFGVEDNWPVFCEPFRQWVLEDKFPTGRPALEEVGVTFVNDVSPYELMKIRILNGGHAAIAYPAALMDIHFVHEAMEEPLIRNFLAKLEREEIIPTVPPVPDTDLDDYFRLIEQALLQSEDRRHHSAAVPGRLQPAAEIHPARRCGPACGWRERDRAVAGLGAMVPVLRGHNRQRQADELQRRQRRTAEAGGAKGKGQPGGVSGAERHIRRGRQVRGFRGLLCRSREELVGAWRAGNTRALSAGALRVCGDSGDACLHMAVFALPVLTYINVRSVPVLEIHHFRRGLT